MFRKRKDAHERQRYLVVAFESKYVDEMWHTFTTQGDQIRFADNLEEAVEGVRELNPTMIIIDDQRMDCGIETFKDTLRELELVGESTKIILLNSSSTAQIQRMNGPTAYATLPLNRTELEDLRSEAFFRLRRP